MVDDRKVICLAQTLCSAYEAYMNNTTRGFVRLGAGLVIIWLLITYICPAIIEAIPAYRAYAHEIDSRGITTSALFYNDVEEAGEAELHIRNTLRFTPRDFNQEK